MFLDEVRFLNGGFCRQFERLTGVRSLRIVRFQAVFIHFRHPVHGECIIDTGYGPGYRREIQRWPWRLLNWLLPVSPNQSFDREDYLSRLSLCPDNIGTIFLSHFHCDHIGGAKQFPRSRFVYRKDVFARLNGLSTIGKLQHGFVPGLLPDDFVARGLPIEEDVFQAIDARFDPILSHDYFSDGSLILLDLPGHALGHTGYLLNTADKQFLYIVDAFWNRDVFRKNIALPRLARTAVHNWSAYNSTLESLRKISVKLKLEPIACHCPRTQKLVNENAH